MATCRAFQAMHGSRMKMSLIMDGQMNVWWLISESPI